MNTRRLVAKAIIVVAITAFAGATSYLFSGPTTKGIDVDAAVSITATVNDDSTVSFAETYQINSDKVKNGNGTRWLYTPAGVSYRFDGVEDTTGPAPQRVDSATSTDSGQERRIHWTYQPKSGLRKFIVRYTIAGAIRLYTEGGQVFSWTFFDARNPLNIDSFSARIDLPPGATAGQNAFARNAGRFSSLNPSDEQVTWNPERVEAGSVVEMTTDFDAPSLGHTPGTMPYPGSGASAAQDIENLWKSKSETQRRTILIKTGAPIVLGLTLISLVIYLRLRYGREYKMANPPMYERELPTKETPAEVGWLDTFGITKTTDLTGTIIDLARRKYLKVEEPPDRSQNVILIATPEGAPRHELAAHEAHTLEWLFSDSSGRVDFNERKYALQANKAKWVTFWNKFTSAIEAIGNEKGLIERKNAYGASCTMLLVGSAAVVAGIVTGILVGPSWVFLSFAGGVMVTSTGGMSSRRSRLGAETWTRWDAFRRYIRDFGTLKDVPPAGVVMWEHYLAYAVVLGEGATVIEYMRLRPPSATGESWYPTNPEVFLWMETGVNAWETFGTPVSSSSSSSDSSSSSSSSSSDFSSGDGGGFGGGGGASFD